MRRYLRPVMGATMRYTIEQLNAARQAKRERSNRGESSGNHGIRQLTATERADRDGPYNGYADQLDADIAEIVQSLMFQLEQNEEIIELYMLQNSEPHGAIEIPF